MVPSLCQEWHGAMNSIYREDPTVAASKNATRRGAASQSPSERQEPNTFEGALSPEGELIRKLTIVSPGTAPALDEQHVMDGLRLSAQGEAT
jgi:hypothetical protein